MSIVANRKPIIGLDRMEHMRDGQRRELVESVTARHPGRRGQIATLFNFFHDPHQPVPSSIHLHDISQGARQAACVAKDVLQSLPHLRIVIVNPLTCPTYRHLFRRLLYSLGDDRSAADERVGSVDNSSSSSNSNVAQTNTSDTGSCDFWIDLLSKRARAILCPAHSHKETSARPLRFVVVIERAERIRDVWSDPMSSVIFRLAELTSLQGSLCVVTSSTLDISHFRSSYGPGSHRSSMSSITVTFGRLDKLHTCATLELELARLIRTRKHAGDDQANVLLSLSKAYVSLGYDALAAEMRDVHELLECLVSLWPAYVKATSKGVSSVEVERSAVLRGHAFFREALSRPYIGQRSILHDGSGSDYATGHRIYQQCSSASGYAAYLMVASFIASYNAPRLDVRFFLRDESTLASNRLQRGDRSIAQRKKGGAIRTRKRRKVGAADVTFETKRQSLGPRSFTLDRLLSIFQALIMDAEPAALSRGVGVRSLRNPSSGREVRDDHTHWESFGKATEVLQCINTLCKIGHLVRTSAMDKLDVNATLRTNVGEESAQRIAKSLGVVLEHYCDQ